MRAKASKTLPEVQFLATDQLEPNPWNRKTFDPDALNELAKSIRAEGIREPLLVRPVSGGRPEHRLTRKAVDQRVSDRKLIRVPLAAARVDRRSGRPPLGSTAALPMYQIASGNRRWLAAQKVGLTKVPCLIETLSDEQVAEDNITMNIQREDIPPLELARMVQDYIAQFEKTQAEACRTFGKSKAWVSGLLGFLKLPGPVLKVFSALNIGWPGLEAIKTLPPEVAIIIVQELEEGTLTPRRLVKRCRQFLYGSHSKGGIQAPEPDPLQKDWAAAMQTMAGVSTAIWEVRYARRKVFSGERELGWEFFIKPQEDISKEAIAEWFEQMAKVLRGKKPADPLSREVKAARRVEQQLVNDLNPRVPRTAVEEKELGDIAVRGTPKDVYRWIYGPKSSMVQIVPFATWKDFGMSPEEGLKTILEGIRSLKLTSPRS